MPGRSRPDAIVLLGVLPGIDGLMKRRTRIAGSILIALLILIGSAIVTVRLLEPPASSDFVDFAEMKRSPTGSDALACAPGLCSARVDLVLAPVPLAAS